MSLLISTLQPLFLIFLRASTRHWRTTPSMPSPDSPLLAFSVAHRSSMSASHWWDTPNLRRQSLAVSSSSAWISSAHAASMSSSSLCSLRQSKMRASPWVRSGQNFLMAGLHVRAILGFIMISADSTFMSENSCARHGGESWLRWERRQPWILPWPLGTFGQKFAMSVAHLSIAGLLAEMCSACTPATRTISFLQVLSLILPSCFFMQLITTPDSKNDESATFFSSGQSATISLMHLVLTFQSRR
mmetsp:Transcript_38051/g.65704  ORF Transcript_38051/g.65704 Transcript_38051/m.65704 type:complete len:245 (-) Transcript_38051:51-785(-)